jgi:hypothetical protein
VFFANKRLKIMVTELRRNQAADLDALRLGYRPAGYGKAIIDELERLSEG